MAKAVKANFVVSGGGGFIGSHVVDSLLNEGFSVTVVDDFKSGGNLANLGMARKIAAEKKLLLKIVKGDVRNQKLWTKLGSNLGFVHLAAQTSVTRSVREPMLDFESNVVSIRGIVPWLIGGGAKLVIYINTAGALYGAGVPIPTPETQSIMPLSPYGATKSVFETYLRAISSSLKAAGKLGSLPDHRRYFTWASLRLANVYGPRQISKGEAGVIPIFVEHFMSMKAPIIFGSGLETRDYVHATDVASAIALLIARMKEEPVDDVFNVGTEKPVATQKIYDLVLENLHSQLGRLGGGASNKKVREWLSEMPKSKSAPLRPGEILHSCVSTQKLRSKLNWRPKYSIEEGIQNTVNAWFSS